ncbi:MAG: hypothetical protein KF706_07285 [Chitinophagales bacterium]|nr:hypothetical protein [Chitinophagales bacterium]OJV25696.1 MAG: hypothetical protein BGO32_01425 [Bacteroidetes bacterium 37-13]
MDIISNENVENSEQTNKNRIAAQKVNEPVYDRYSIIFVMIITAVILFFLLKEEKAKYAAYSIGILGIALGYTASQPARIRRNDYEGFIQFKGENDCGFSDTAKTEIDGIKFLQPLSHPAIFKAPNGTDITIDKNGNVQFVGFGSRLVNMARNGGYINTAPDKCWN